MGKLYPQSLYDVLSSIVDNVYFTPPERLQYPCIICDVDDIEMVKADDKVYSKSIRYQLTVISREEDNTYGDSIIDSFEYCRFNRRYVIDNLCHDIFIIYY